MEPISFTIGVAGLSGLLTASLEVLDHIYTAKSYGEDYDLFITKIEIERLRLFRWGQAVGLADGGITHENLHDPAVQRAVCELFRRAICFLEDSEMVKKRHSVERPTRGFTGIPFILGRARSLQTLGADRETLVVAATAVDDPRGRARKLQKEASKLRKVKWTISGKPKSEKLLHELGWFVDRLHTLVPIPGPQPHQQSHHAMNPPRVEEIPAILQLPSPATSDIVHLRSMSGRNRMEQRRLESSIPRRRMKHTCRTAARAAAEAERKIRANER
jgi:hypothetical protein